MMKRPEQKQAFANLAPTVARYGVPSSLMTDLGKLSSKPESWGSDGQIIGSPVAGRNRRFPV